MNIAKSVVGAIIPAAGASARFGKEDKMFAHFGGRPVLAHVIDTFQKCSLIDRIIVIVNEESLETCRQMIADNNWSKVAGIFPGGKRRQDSVFTGLSRLGTCDWVVIHDGARPLVTENLISRGLQEAMDTGSAVAAVPVTDTIKMAGESATVRRTLPRHALWLAQTPQVFRFDIISQAYSQIVIDVTDDASLVEQIGYRVKLYMGTYDNIKITTPDDLVIAEALWQKREQ